MGGPGSPSSVAARSAERVRFAGPARTEEERPAAPNAGPGPGRMNAERTREEPIPTGASSFGRGPGSSLLAARSREARCSGERRTGGRRRAAPGPAGRSHGAARRLPDPAAPGGGPEPSLRSRAARAGRRAAISRCPARLDPRAAGERSIRDPRARAPGVPATPSRVARPEDARPGDPSEDASRATGPEAGRASCPSSDAPPCGLPEKSSPAASVGPPDRSSVRARRSNAASDRSSRGVSNHSAGARDRGPRRFRRRSADHLGGAGPGEPSALGDNRPLAESLHGGVGELPLSGEERRQAFRVPRVRRPSRSIRGASRT